MKRLLSSQQPARLWAWWMPAQHPASPGRLQHKKPHIIAIIVGSIDLLQRLSSAETLLAWQCGLNGRRAPPTQIQGGKYTSGVRT